MLTLQRGVAVTQRRSARTHEVLCGNTARNRCAQSHHAGASSVSHPDLHPCWAPRHTPGANTRARQLCSHTAARAQAAQHTLHTSKPAHHAHTPYMQAGTSPRTHSIQASRHITSSATVHALCRTGTPRGRGTSARTAAPHRGAQPRSQGGTHAVSRDNGKCRGSSSKEHGACL
jgi:hypothetical protein